MQDVRITNTGSLLELQRRLRAAGGDNIRRSMQRRIRRAAEPLRDGLQDSIRGLDIRSQGRTTRPGGPSPTTRPLRATLAEAIRISVRTTGNPGARVWLDKGRLPPDLQKSNVPEQLNTGRLRHPVFGNKRRWVNQYATPLWWDRVVRQQTPRMQREVERVLGDVRSRLS
ncbi:hypothetical protein [Streptomyces himalayensis]|uniref:HK97 gp10 family phage protein n=1 Tax=Streptomyces himalayensis subsp. himalayensis TaxID=2756131 RepID=A0A7W0DUM8_9ACTN|nr:hypothetical protein [Streptomyces himalayensis]MBA2951586.1 hypothetical protein [Streptomyces himalayensis subsp. himalayensis]